LKNTFGVSGYPDYKHILDDPDIQIVLISTPHHLHADIAEEAARKGKHIMVEKPLATTWDDCKKIHQAVKTNNVLLMPAHIGRFTPAFMSAEEYLATNIPGTILSARSISISMWKHHDRQQWHLQKSCGGGYLLTLGIHQIDLLCALVSSRVVKVYAKLQNVFHGDETDDSGTAVLHFENGVVANLQMIGYRSGVGQVETEFFCEHGMLKVSFSQGAYYSEGGKWILLNGSKCEDWMEKALVNEWVSFRKLLQGEDAIKISLDQAMHVMEIVFAIFRSSDLGCEVKLPFDENP
jgi:predicted dehydrogenase